MRFFSLNKNQVGVIATLMTLVLLGAIYFFIYLPHNEKRLQGQRFTVLQNIDRNVHAKIDNSGALLNNILSAYLKGNAAERKKLEDYINGYSRVHFTLSVPKQIDAATARAEKDSSGLDSSYSLKVNNDTRLVKLMLNKRVPANGDTIGYRIGMEFSYDQFFRLLLPPGIFDEYIVFCNDKPVYETFQDGISAFKKDTLLGVMNGVSGAGIRSYTVGGLDYKFFLQPVKLMSNTEWVVGGLLSGKNYQEKKSELPAQIVLLLVTIVLIIMISLPWLKLYQMGSKDRLTIKDAIASVLISMLLMSLLFFLFFHYNNKFRPSDNPDPKSVIAESIQQSLLSETAAAFAKLQQFDELMEPGKDMIKVGDTAVAYADKTKLLDTTTATKLKAISKGISVNQVFWLDATGTELTNWTSGTVNSPHGNFKNRSYFSSMAEQRGYHFPAQPQDMFYLDQVISWTSFAFTSVLSYKSVQSKVDSPLIACLSFNMKSLDKTVLPTGFEFAIIDKDSKVLYHADKSRNLNEKLLDKFSNSDPLRSSIKAAAPTSFSTVYYDHKYDVSVEPLNTLPYFIVVFEDNDFGETRITENYSFTFSMLTLFFAFLVMQLMAIFIVSSKRSFFKKQFFDTGWIGPKISSHKEYVLAIVMNCIIIFVLVISFSGPTFLGYLFKLFFAATFIPLFLNAVFARRYRALNKSAYRFKYTTIYSLMLLTTIIDIIAFKVLDASTLLSLLLYELLLVVLGVIVYLGRGFIFNTCHSLSKRNSLRLIFMRWSYVNSFSLMAITRLIITSGIPVVFFYAGTYNYEQNISLRYRQTEFAKHLLDKLSADERKILKPGDGLIKGVYVDSSSVNHYEVLQQKPGSGQVYTCEEDNTLLLLRQFRLKLTEKSVNEDQYYFAGAADSSFYFNHLLRESCNDLNGSLVKVAVVKPDKYIGITSRSLNYQFPSLWHHVTFNGILFWVLLLTALAGFYFIIHTIISKLFALNLPDIDIWKGLDSRILSANNLNDTLFVIGLPGSGKKHYLTQKIASGEITLDNGDPVLLDDKDDTKNNGFIAELINIPSTASTDEEKVHWKKYCKKVFDEKNRLIIVNHFEYNIQDAISNHYKLEFLEKLFLENHCKIIILSTIHPVAFLDSVDHFIQKADSQKPSQDLERWHVLLGHYRIVVLPLKLDLNENLQQAETQHLPIIPPPMDSSTIFKELILKETNNTHFLKKMQQPIFDTAEQMQAGKSVAKFDELAFKLQITAHYFYMYIWQSLTKEEKFLLYDLAEDNLVNSFDDYNLSMLLSKGVIIRKDGTIRFFNKGFRNFILSAIGNSEAMKIKNQIRENGNWNSLKNPLQIIIIAILLFLFASQEEAFSKMVTYVAALGAGIPAVLKLFSLFEKSSQKSA